MSETDETTQADADEAAIAAEVEEITKSPSDQQADRVKSALIAAKKELKAAQKRNAELEPVAARTADVEAKLNQAQPLIAAILKNPKLQAEALRMAGMTRPSGDTTEQPTSDEDPDAAWYAEEHGMTLNDGTPDVARARRALDRLDQRAGRVTDQRLRPLAQMTLGGKAAENVRRAAQMTDDDGTPLVTQESLKETIDMLGGEESPMLANPRVVDLLINNAIGLDRRKGRTPKPVDEPLHLDRSGGRGSREPQITGYEKAKIERLGLTEKSYTNAGKQLATGKAIEFRD